MEDQTLLAVSGLERIAGAYPALANQMANMPFFKTFEAHDAFALASISHLIDEGPIGGVDLLAGQGWFSDGLDDDEATFVTVLGVRGEERPDEFQSLLNSHETESKTVTLPLTGKVQLTVFRLAPDARTAAAMTHLEEAVRVLEDFMSVALPSNEIIMLLANPNAEDRKAAGINAATHIVVVRTIHIQDNSLV